MSTQNGGTRWGTIAAVVSAVAALITALVGVAALSDGGDEERGPTPSPAPTEEQSGPTLEAWARDAEPICAQGAADIAAASAQITPDASFEQSAAGFRAIADAIQRRNDRLGELAAPADAEQDVERMVELADEVASELETAASGIERADQATVAAASDRALRQAERTTEVASRLGVPACRLELAGPTG